MSFKKNDRSCKKDLIAKQIILKFPNVERNIPMVILIESFQGGLSLVSSNSSSSICADAITIAIENKIGKAEIKTISSKPMLDLIV